MFVKENERKKDGKVYKYFYIVQSCRGPDGISRHQYLANISELPMQTIESIRGLLKGDLVPADNDVEYHQGDSLRGAGQMALWRAWKKSGLLKVLEKFLTKTQCLSVFAMTVSRILNPASKLALKRECADTFWAKGMADNRLDEDTLYEVMDRLEASFEGIQQKLAEAQPAAPTLMLYDTTSTYFEGTEAQNGEYGFSKDKRFDRYQVIIAMVCDKRGRPLAVELWPGNTTDVDTVQSQIDMLRKRFGIGHGIFVGDNGMHSKVNLDYITEKGLSYIIGGEYHKKKKLLCSMSQGQRELFVKEGTYEWVEDGVRYIACHSECRRHREKTRRERRMEYVEEQLKHLKKSASGGRYYTKERLWAKIDGILREKKVKSLWNIELEPLEEAKNDKQKILIALKFSKNMVEVKKRRALDGSYLLETSVESEEMKPQEVVDSYKSLQKVERSFRTIKSFIKVRPVYHHLWRRIRAHVLICFLSYYLTWWMREELKTKGINTELTTVLKRWDQLSVSELRVNTDADTIVQWNWSLGEVGVKVKEEIEQVGLWNSLNSYKSQCSALRRDF